MTKYEIKEGNPWWSVNDLRRANGLPELEGNMATIKKNEYIKTADFESKFGELINDIQGTKYITKTAILSLINDFRNKLITYEPREELEVYKFMEVR